MYTSSLLPLADRLLNLRPDTLDPALLRPGRIDRRVEFSLPDVEGRANILRIHARSMSTERNIRYDLIARLCPNTTGAELRSVCTEAGMFAIRQRRKVASEKDFLDAVEKVIRQGSKFSSSGVSPDYSILYMWNALTNNSLRAIRTALPTIQLEKQDYWIRRGAAGRRPCLRPSSKMYASSGTMYRIEFVVLPATRTSLEKSSDLS